MRRERSLKTVLLILLGGGLLGVGLILLERFEYVEHSQILSWKPILKKIALGIGCIGIVVHFARRFLAGNTGSPPSS